MLAGISNADFDALVGDLVATLNKFKVPEDEKTELLSVLGPMRKDIVERPEPLSAMDLLTCHRIHRPRVNPGFRFRQNQLIRLCQILDVTQCRNIRQTAE